MRYEVLQDGPHGYHNLSPQGVQNSSLSVRRLWILDCILENRDLDSSVTRLVRVKAIIEWVNNFSRVPLYRE